MLHAVAVHRYKALVDALAADIRAGRWRPGTRLPTHRALAAREGIAVVTATRVYAELEAMSLVSCEQGRGTFVRDLSLPVGHSTDYPQAEGGMADLVLNYPFDGEHTDLLRQALRDLAGAGDVESVLRYQPHRGRRQDLGSVGDHLRRRGLAVGDAQLLITSGAQHGLAITAMATLRAGDAVAVDALTYPGFTVLARLLGLDLVPVPTTGDGEAPVPDLVALERMCRQRRVRAVYTMPTLHNPLGWVMDRPSRDLLVDIARRHDVLLVEDCSYAYLVEDAPPALARLAPERTVHVGGLSKNIANGLRIGYVAAPPALVPELERAVRATTWNTPALLCEIACRWLDDGTVDRLERIRRQDASARQAVARSALRGLDQVAHPYSYFTWLPLPESARADRVVGDLRSQGIAVSTAEPFATTEHVPQAVRVALGSVPLTALSDALDTVREVISLDGYS
ncbi:PLP-dependent aminotransferase family protein [Actinomycetes bacterium KLBMP 9759]